MKGNSIMAKTDSGKKKVYVTPHKKQDGTTVRRHYRSTPSKPGSQPTKSR